MIEFYRGRRVFISGNTGFKGSWLTLFLLHLGAEVFGYALPSVTTPSLYGCIGLDRHVQQIYGDIRDNMRLQNTLKEAKPEMVFHLAAQPLVRQGYRDPAETFDVNLMGTVNILESVRATPSVRACIIATTDKVYASQRTKAYDESDPLGGSEPYSASKACAELATQCYSRSFFPQDGTCRIATVRAGNVIGGGDWSSDRLIPDLIRAAYCDQGTIKLRNPEAIRPWQHVLDCLQGYVQLGQALDTQSNFSGAWNIAPPIASCIRVEDLVCRGLSLLKASPSYHVVPDAVRHEEQILQLDASKATDQLGWRPRLTLDDTLQWTFDWYRQFYTGQTAADLTESQIQRFMNLSEAELTQ